MARTKENSLLRTIFFLQISSADDAMKLLKNGTNNAFNDAQKTAVKMLAKSYKNFLKKFISYLDNRK